MKLPTLTIEQARAVVLEERAKKKGPEHTVSITHKPWSHRIQNLYANTIVQEMRTRLQSPLMLCTIQHNQGKIHGSQDIGYIQRDESALGEINHNALKKARSALQAIQSVHDRLLIERKARLGKDFKEFRKETCVQIEFPSIQAFMETEEGLYFAAICRNHYSPELQEGFANTVLDKAAHYHEAVMTKLRSLGIF